MRGLIALMLGVFITMTASGASDAHAPARVESAIPAATTWMSVLLEGRKIGSLRIDRAYGADTIRTTQTLVVQLNRAGQPLQLRSTNQTTESLTGEPLAFAASSALSEMDNTVQGKRIGYRRFTVSSQTGGAVHTTQIQLAPDVLMFEAQRRAMMHAPRTPGAHYRLRQFDPASQQSMDVDMEVIGNETVPLPDGSMVLSHQRQRLLLPGGGQVADLWLDRQGVARKGVMRLLGRTLQMIACDQACAQAPVQSIDMFRAAMVTSPRPLTANLRNEALNYRIHVDDGHAAALINTDEQHVSPLGHGEFLVAIRRAAPGRQAGPTAADTDPTLWLQSRDPAIRALASQVAGKASRPRDTMRRLRRFVSDYITQQGLDVGYASALEVLHNKKGDCTEYAVLLAALARAQGIPARVVTGMVYADRYAGALRVFVPHAWVQAWVNGRWESYDAALRRFDATHIALATGNGDPGRYFEATQLFGHLRIERVLTDDEQLAPAAPPSAPVTPAAQGSGR